MGAGQTARSSGRAVAALWLRTVPPLARAAALERLAAPRAPRRAPRHRPDSVLSALATDLRFALRMLRKNPLFTAVAVLCLSLGSGAVTTIFSAMNAMVLRPLPGARAPERLVRIDRRDPGSDNGRSASYPYFAALRARTRALDAVVGWSKVSLAVGRPGEPGAAVYGNLVSGDLFTVLGVRPALGRFFLPDEDRTELTHPVVVVSEGFWRNRLGADSGAVGRQLTVNGRPYTLVGVAPAEFGGLDAPIATDAWVPLHMQRQLRPVPATYTGDPLADAGLGWLRLAGRLREGATAEDARRELAALTAAVIAEGSEPKHLADYTEIVINPLTGLPPDASAPLTRFLALLLGAAAAVLLIASINVAAMLSARAVARRREMAVRAALGAGRGRIVRQLLTEILLLFAAGAAGGVALAWGATAALERVPIPTEVPVTLELSPDPRVLVFALLVSLVSGVVVGLAPARRAARADITEQLRNGAAASTARRGWLGTSLVVGQLALSLLLLVGAGLFTRALQRAARTAPGFDATGVATASLNTESWGYDEARGRRFYRALGERLAATPGVTAVSAASLVPLGMRTTNEEIRVEGAERAVPVAFMSVDPGYFAALHIPLAAGRVIAPRDDERAPRVAVVNETLARRHWPGTSPLGRTFTFRGAPVTVVGVARDAKYAWLNEQTPALAYFPLAQLWEPKQAVLVRTAGDPRTLTRAVQAAAQLVDPAVPPPTVVPLTEAMAVGLLPQRMAGAVTAVLGLTGLVLATVGLYGIIAYSAGRRAREIGIRLALGARRADVLRMVVGEGARLTAVGVGAGLLLAAAATRLLASLLFGVSPLDVATYAATSVLFAAVALLASWLPARRAAAVDPTTTLRGE